LTRRFTVDAFYPKNEHITSPSRFAALVVADECVGGNRNARRSKVYRTLIAEIAIPIASTNASRLRASALRSGPFPLCLGEGFFDRIEVW
jgi:hypothetical protein